MLEFNTLIPIKFYERRNKDGAPLSLSKLTMKRQLVWDYANFVVDVSRKEVR